MSDQIAVNQGMRRGEDPTKQCQQFPSSYHISNWEICWHRSLTRRRRRSWRRSQRRNIGGPDQKQKEFITCLWMIMATKDDVNNCGSQGTIRIIIIPFYQLGSLHTGVDFDELSNVSHVALVVLMPLLRFQ